MAPSFDCTASSLLCAEDNNSLMCFDDFGVVEDEFERGVCGQENHQTHYQNLSFFKDGDFFLMGFSLQSEECFGLMVQRECEHLPTEDYLNRLQCGDLDLGIRREAVDWIGKVHAYYNFGPLSAYLSVNYLDRFLSAYELPRSKAWMMQLLAVACLSLAAKMEETEVPMPLDLQIGESKYVFEARTIQRMELLVLSTLKWRMQAVTPFTFIDYFLSKINNDDNPPPRSSISRSIKLILSTIKGIEFLKFRPSEVSASVAICVLGETQTVDINKVASCLIKHVEKERVLKCVELIQNVSVLSGFVKVANSRGASVTSVPHSPIGVLDAACLSYKSDDLTVGSCANSTHSSPDPKRRKISKSSEVVFRS